MQESIEKSNPRWSSSITIASASGSCGGLQINLDARHRPRWRVATGLEGSRRPAAGAHTTSGHTGGGRPAGRAPRGLGTHHCGGPHSRGPGADGLARRTTPSTDSTVTPGARWDAWPYCHGQAGRHQRPHGRAMIVTSTRITTSHHHALCSSRLSIDRGTHICRLDHYNLMYNLVQSVLSLKPRDNLYNLYNL
jgi:hypothetical protein